ncbi:hypothetical protein D9M73_83140 [compost metagenome]
MHSRRQRSHGIGALPRRAGFQCGHGKTHVLCTAKTPVLPQALRPGGAQTAFRLEGGRQHRLVFRDGTELADHHIRCPGFPQHRTEFRRGILYNAGMRRINNQQARPKQRLLQGFGRVLFRRQNLQGYARLRGRLDQPGQACRRHHIRRQQHDALARGRGKRTGRHRQKRQQEHRRTKAAARAKTFQEIHGAPAGT